MAKSDVPGYEFSIWYGIQVPANTSPAIIEKLNADVTRVLQASDVRSRLSTLGLVPMTSSPEAFGSVLHAEITKWTKVAKAIKL